MRKPAAGVCVNQACQAGHVTHVRDSTMVSLRLAAQVGSDTSLMFIFQDTLYRFSLFSHSAGKKKAFYRVIITLHRELDFVQVHLNLKLYC